MSTLTSSNNTHRRFPVVIRRKLTSGLNSNTIRTNSPELCKQVVLELYKTIYARMSSHGSSVSMAIDLVSATSMSTSPLSSTSQHDEPVSRSLTMFEQEAMRQTPKLLRLSQHRTTRDSPEATAKSMVHVLFEMYDEEVASKVKNRPKIAKLRVVKKNSMANVIVKERATRHSIANQHNRLKIHTE